MRLLKKFWWELILISFVALFAGIKYYNMFNEEHIKPVSIDHRHAE